MCRNSGHMLKSSTKNDTLKLAKQNQRASWQKSMGCRRIHVNAAEPELTANPNRLATEMVLSNANARLSTYQDLILTPAASDGRCIPSTPTS